MTILDWQREVHRLAVEKGWWTEGEKRNLGEMICLIHCELSEAFEHHREGMPVYFDGVDGKPDGFSIELADAVIRILDLCESLGIDLERCIQIKHEYNKTRPYRHGGKKA
jgi:NTP pyrophosphatase (non-canonical NTP hydrolase)